MAANPKIYACSALLVAIAGVLFWTNPKTTTYEAFAVAEAKEFLATDACDRPLPLVGNSLKEECVQFVQSDASTPLFLEMIRQGTQRQNWGLWSLYRTRLDVKRIMPALPQGLIPVYEVKSIGILNTVIVYQVEEQ